jgi:long-chain acyl-CoA synthetase
MDALSEVGTVPGALIRNAQDRPNDDAFVFRANGRWRRMSWKQLAEKVTAVAAGLITEGGGNGRAIAVHSGNNELSVVLDLAAQSIGDHVVPIYPIADTEQIERVLEATEPFLLFTQDSLLLERDRAITRPSRPATEKEVARLQERGTDTAAVRERLEALSPDTTAVALVTDASEGDDVPIVHLSHALVAAQCKAVAEAFNHQPSDRRYSLLPWAHVYERVQAVYGGVHGAIPTWVAQDYSTLLRDFQQSRPTLFGGAPRVFQHLHGLLLETLRGESGRRAIDLDDAQADLLQRAAMSIRNPWSPARLSVRWKPSYRKVQADVRAQLGGQVRALTSAFSPMDSATALFFHAVGLPIYEGYGHAQAGGLIATNRPDAYQFGTLGRPLQRARVRVAYSRLHVRGPGMTQEISTPELAEVTPKGYVRVVGSDNARVSMRGINLSPTLEEAVVMSDPLVDQCAIVDSRMQVVPNRPALEDWAWVRHVANNPAPEEDPEVRFRLEALSRRDVDIVDRLVPTTKYPSHVDEVEAALDDFGRPVVGLKGHRAARRRADTASRLRAAERRS